MKSIAALALLLMVAAAPAAAEDWFVARAPSDTPDLLAASTVNADGHRLYVWPFQDRERRLVMIELHLADGLALAAMPRYRIDDGAEVNTDIIRQEGERANAMWGNASGGVAFWKAWSGSEPLVPESHPFRQWYTGDNVAFTLPLADGSERTTVFPLTGAAAAILAATAVGPE